jgi:hypothetical protein
VLKVEFDDFATAQGAAVAQKQKDRHVARCLRSVGMSERLWNSAASPSAMALSLLPWPRPTAHSSLAVSGRGLRVRTTANPA